MSDDDSAADRAIETALAEAKLELDRAFRTFVQSQMAGEESQQVASAQLHTAVMDLYWQLYVQLQAESDAWESVEGHDAVGGEHIWQGTHPRTGDDVTIGGLADLEAWADKTKTVGRGGSGSLGMQERDMATVTLRLPAGAALAAAKVLKYEFSQTFKLGVDVSTEQQTYIDEDLLEEVKEWRLQNV